MFDNAHIRLSLTRGKKVYSLLRNARENFFHYYHFHMSPKWHHFYYESQSQHATLTVVTQVVKHCVTRTVVFSMCWCI